MAKYKVLENGFFNGKLYSPTGARPVLEVDKPFSKKDMPSWVEPMKAERNKKSKVDDTPNPTNMDFLSDTSSSTVETL